MAESRPRELEAAGLRRGIRIPSHYHFIWFGGPPPHFAKLAIRSVLRRCSGAKVTLWVEPGPRAALRIPELLEYANFEVRAFDIEAELELIEGLRQEERQGLARVWWRLTQNAALANLARLTLLAAHGGIYLDTDTLVLKDLDPFRKSGAFCGMEPVIWPYERKQRWDAYRIAGGPMLGFMRNLAASDPHGFRWHRHLEGFGFKAVNNAVLGAERGHSLTLEGLRRIAVMPDDELTVRYRLGTHLLQQLVASREHAVDCYDPRYFYPLGPVVSKHYFIARHDAEAATREIVDKEAFVVHWYGSVSDLSALDDGWIHGPGAKTVCGQLCRPLTAGAPALPPRSTAYPTRLGWGEA